VGLLWLTELVNLAKHSPCDAAIQGQPALDALGGESNALGPQLLPAQAIEVDVPEQRLERIGKRGI